MDQELILLGLLRQGPKHGYEIKVKVREILSLFAGVRLKSIYYPLKILEKKGLLARSVVKKGKRPARLVYCLTSGGKKRFEALLNKSLLDFKRPQFTLDLSLYFLSYLPVSLARRRLAARLSILKKISLGIEKLLNSRDLKGSLPHSRILEHNLCLLRAESAFLTSLLKKI
ncbi:MAG: PadR family transcriptional regulator [Candidatus Omnitrophota bacterium]|nr:PadR family transcriptional regulator [Candidatus Omnitrophota bacterium]